MNGLFRKTVLSVGQKKHEPAVYKKCIAGTQTGSFQKNPAVYFSVIRKTLRLQLQQAK